jgi:hypothetical protein
MMQENIKPEIYGWMTVSISKWKRYDIANVDYLTARHNKSAFKGIGTSLIQQMERHMEDLYIDFIKLMPIETASSFYTKMGYTPCLNVNGKTPYLMCKTLRHDPSYAYATYLDKKKMESVKEDKDNEQSILTDIRSQLSEPEQEIFDTKIKEESFLNTVVFVYLDEEQGGIGQVKKLLETSGGKQSRKNKQSRKKYKRSRKINV